LAGWRLDPIAGLEGAIRAFITDAAWVIDADVTLPLRGGTIDFDTVVVEHLGPNSSMGISRGGLYIDAPNNSRRYLFVFTGGDLPGATFEQRRAPGFGGRKGDRGALDLNALALGLLEHRGLPFGRAASQEVADTLDRTRLNGEMHLGDGWIGTDRHRALLAGQAHGRNRLSVLAEVVGRQLAISLLDMSVSEAVFDVGGTPGRCGPLSADLRIEVTGLREVPAVTLSLRLANLQSLVIGDPDA